MTVMDADKFRVFLDRQYRNCHGYMGNKKEVYREALLAVKSYVHSEGQVDAEPVRHGHWIVHEGKWVPTYECSECHAEGKIDGNYCPDCGAKMDEGK